MKKLAIGLLTGGLAIGLLATVTNSYATDFTGQEDKYIELCKSATLSTNDQETCREFNTYLKDKNKDLAGKISETKTDIDKSKSTLEDIDKDLTTIKNDIAIKETEISYLETSITNLETDLTDKEELLRDRMYEMQSYMNTNFFLDFIFSASNFTDMMSRMDSIEELTAYDKELISSILNDKKELESQKDTMATAKGNLEKQKGNQETLQSEYLALYQKQNSDLVNQEKQSMENTDTSQEIDDNLAALAAASKESEVGGVTEATPPANPAPPTNPTPSEPDPGGNENSGGGSGATPGNTGNYEVGLRVANAALSKQGSPYVWGAKGPNSFDCSGFVYWAHNAAGVNMTYSTTAGLSSRGVAVSYNNLQAGDIVTFTTVAGRVSHVGIYIGNGKMVHAPVPGQNVQVANLNTNYWQSCYYNARRLY